MDHHFKYNPNLCVHCHACAAACSLENGGEQTVPWRTVINSNRSHHPQVHSIHVSMACNHCQEAACLRYCPASAYSFDSTGAVLIDDSLCMGCSYCTWVCPYQAPRLNERGVIEKCTFCVHRLRDYREPACSIACPTGALGFDQEEEYRQDMPGYLPDTGIRPRLDATDESLPQQKIFSRNPPPDHREADTSGAVHIHPATEWSLWLFTATGSLLFGIVSASFGKAPLIPWWLFAMITASTGAFSLIHLKNPANMLRVFHNLRQSPLSREILFYGLFSLSALFSLAFPMPLWYHYFVFLNGILLLVSMDQIYSIADRSLHVLTHSAGTLLTGLMWLFYFRADGYIFLFFVCLKAALFTWHIFSAKGKTGQRLLMYVLRVGLLITGLWFFFRDGLVWYSVLPVVFSEFSDRLLFYNDLKPVAVSRSLNVYSRERERTAAG